MLYATNQMTLYIISAPLPSLFGNALNFIVYLFIDNPIPRFIVLYGSTADSPTFTSLFCHIFHVIINTNYLTKNITPYANTSIHILYLTLNPLHKIVPSSNVHVNPIYSSPLYLNISSHKNTSKPIPLPFFYPPFTIHHLHSMIVFDLLFYTSPPSTYNPRILKSQGLYVLHYYQSHHIH